MRILRVAIGAAFLGLLIASCGGGISREHAIEIALAQSGTSGATAIRAERGPLLRFTLGRTTVDGSPDRMAWAVTLHGTFPGECVVDAAGASVCPPGATSKLVVIDAATGAFIFSESPAP